MRPLIGIAVIGLGWMGQAHSRSYRRIQSLFPDREGDPDLVVCADPVASRRLAATRDFGFATATDDWRRAVDDPAVSLVIVAAPNALHLDVVTAAASAGKAVFCEKPVGGTPAQARSAALAAAGVTTGVGYNYRWAPMVRHAKSLIDAGRLGTITNYRGRFLSSYGSDPLGVLSWRFDVGQGGYGASTDLLCHAVDLATHLLGPVTELVGSAATMIPERPLPSGAGTHFDRGRPDDPVGTVTNEDWTAALVRFAGGAVGMFEASRVSTGADSQHAFEIDGTLGSLRWDLQRLNELDVRLAGDDGYTTVFGGERFADHGAFAPGRANGIGFEDMICIEDHHFLDAVAAGRPFRPSLADAVAYADVQDALIRSWASRRWETVTSGGPG
ncbi:MAG: Gfo/Idh/MocA family oxidoreductase [Ilumatobacteraceae bacterium]